MKTAVSQAAILVLLCALVADGAVVYVKVNGTGSGASWSDAASLQDALTNAVDGDSLWLQEGVYKPGALQSETFTLNFAESESSVKKP